MYENNKETNEKMLQLRLFLNKSFHLKSACPSLTKRFHTTADCRQKKTGQFIESTSKLSESKAPARVKLYPGFQISTEESRNKINLENLNQESILGNFFAMKKEFKKF